MENRNEYFCKKIYNNHIYHGCIRDPKTVSKDFINDFINHKPIQFIKGTNRYFITFALCGGLVFYELPIDYEF